MLFVLFLSCPFVDSEQTMGIARFASDMSDIFALVSQEPHHLRFVVIILSRRKPIYKGERMMAGCGLQLLSSFPLQSLCLSLLLSVRLRILWRCTARQTLRALYCILPNRS